MTYFITDTHPLIWSLCAPHHLSYPASDVFEQAVQGHHTIFIPAVVIAELTMAVEKQLIPLSGDDLLQTFMSLRNASNYVFLPLLPATAIASHKLSHIPDMFDRLVIAEAQRLKVPLVTCDPAIIESGLVDVIWD